MVFRIVRLILEVSTGETFSWVVGKCGVCGGSTQSITVVLAVERSHSSDKMYCRKLDKPNGTKL